MRHNPVSNQCCNFPDNYFYVTPSFERGGAKTPGVCSIPAPVVPPLRFEESNDGDCSMTKSFPAVEMCRENAFGSIKPRFWEVNACENSINDSKHKSAPLGQ